MCTEPPTTDYDLKGDPSHGYARLKDIALALGVEKDGVHTASVLDRATTFEVKKIPTGIFHLDWYTGGGVPLNRITRIGGPKDSFKTTTMYKILYHAQNYCRYCKTPLIKTENGMNCQCPSPRYKLTNSIVLQYLTRDDDVDAVLLGRIPPSAVKKKSGVTITTSNGMSSTFEETYRCAPFQTLFIETEHKMDKSWAAANGVDNKLVVVLGCVWGEKLIDTVEQMMYTSEVDIIFIDTISMLSTKETITKSAEDNEKIAGKARIKQRFLEKIVCAQYSGGVMTDRSVTVVMNSQVRTKGIGGFRPYIGVNDGNVVDHLVSLDLYFRQKKFHFIHANYASEGEYEFTIKKNHSGGASGIAGTFKVWLDPCGERAIGDTDDMALVIKYGRQTELIKKSTKYYIGEDKLGFKTIPDLNKYLVENPTVFNGLRHAVLQALQDVRLEKPKKKEKGE